MAMAKGTDYSDYLEQVVSGGVPLSGLSWVAAGGKFPVGVMKAPLKAAAMTSGSKNTVGGGSGGGAWHFDQLFVDGERAVRGASRPCLPACLPACLPRCAWPRTCTTRASTISLSCARRAVEIKRSIYIS